MSLSGSRSVSSIKAFQELPNLPGIRRSALSSNPRIFKEYLAETMGNHSTMNSSHSTGLLDDPEFTEHLKSTLTPYPSCTPSFNDVTARYSLCSRQRDRQNNIRPLPYSDIRKAPAFVTNKDQLCNFTAYFIENVPENLEEQNRLRMVDITVYVTDQTLEIREPFQNNSGLVQGKVLRRHRAPKPDGSGYYGLADFYAGVVLTIYNREYTVINCNEFTYNYLQSIGVEFGEPIEEPESTDPRQTRLRQNLSTSSLLNSTNSTTSFSAASRPYTALSKSFYEHDKMVLRFYGYWEGKEKPKSIKYSVRLHYYLTDNTIEIISEYTRNDGRDRVPKFLRKMRVLKPNIHIQENSMLTASQIELDSNCYYHWTDIRIGTVLNIVGNDILIYDADEFTRRYYEKEDEPLEDPIYVQLEDPQIKYVVEPPPYNGFGSEEDSLQTCSGSLMPKPPKKDGLKAKLYAQKFLMYRMKFKDPSPVDADREFNLQVFLEDDTLQITEIPQRNSGFSSGKFLARSRQNHQNGQRILPGDIRLGGLLEIQSFKFLILDADEHSLKYMECNSDIWRESSLESITKKLHTKENELRDILVQMKDKALEDISYDEMKKILRDVGLDLSIQETLTLLRAMDKKKKGKVKYFRLFRILNDEDMFSSWSHIDNGFDTQQNTFRSDGSLTTSYRESNRRRK